MSSIRNRRLLAQLGAFSLGGCLLLAGAGCETHHQPDPMHTLVKETRPLPGTAAPRSVARVDSSGVYVAPSPSTAPAAAARVDSTGVYVAPSPSTEPPVYVAPPPSSPAHVHVAYEPPAKSHESKILKWMGVDEDHRDPVQPNPPPDAAILARNWDASASYYPSGAAVAFPTYATDRDQFPPKFKTDTARGLLDPVIFIGDTLTLPIQMFLVAPWKEVVYPGVTYGPTQTAAPPLPAN